MQFLTDGLPAYTIAKLAVKIDGRLLCDAFYGGQELFDATKSNKMDSLRLRGHLPCHLRQSIIIEQDGIRS